MWIINSVELNSMIIQILIQEFNDQQIMEVIIKIIIISNLNLLILNNVRIY